MSDWLHGKRPNVLTSKAPKTIYIRDINPDFNLSNNTMDLVVENDDALKNQIRHLLSTPIGSEDFEPTFGSNLPYRLNDPICSLTAYLLESDTIFALIAWMGNKLSLVTPSIVAYPDNDLYVAHLPYRKLGENTVTVFSFEFGV